MLSSKDDTRLSTSDDSKLHSAMSAGCTILLSKESGSSPALPVASPRLIMNMYSELSV